MIKEPLEAGIVGQDDFPNVGAAGKAMEPGEIEEPCVALFKAECSNLLDQFGTLQHGIPIGAGRAPAEANISGSIGRGNRPWKFIPRARTYSNEKVSSPADGLPGLFSGLILGMWCEQASSMNKVD